MLTKRAVKANLALVPGKHTQEPNIVLVPAGAKSFAVGIEWTMEADESVVIGSRGKDSPHRWCVLDGNLKQVMHGVAGSPGKGPKKAEAVVARTIRGGGSGNPRQITIEMKGSKLANGTTYTLIASRHGVAAAGDFVALHAPKLKAAPKKKATGKKKAAPKKKAGKK